jgi:2-hydroxychromene-2-carboxylate isomerase
VDLLRGMNPTSPTPPPGGYRTAEKKRWRRRTGLLLHFNITLCFGFKRGTFGKLNTGGNGGEDGPEA